MDIMSRSFCFSADTVSELSEKIQNFSDFHPALGIIFSSVTLGIPELASEISVQGFLYSDVRLQARS